MIAYSRESLDNLDIQQEAAEALERAILTPAEFEQIRQAHPFRLYMPNIFVRIGLFLLTFVAVVCGAGLFVLISMGSSERGIGAVLIFVGISCYVVSELFIHLRHVFRAGVDDALHWMGAGLIFGGISLVSNNMSALMGSWLVFGLALWSVLRYADSAMALAAYGGLVSVIYHLLIPNVAFGSAILPFVIMAVSVAGYFVATHLADDEECRHYRSCLVVLRAATLVTFYLSGNYYIAQKVNASINGETLGVPLGWLWWIFTGVVPVFYVVAGLKRKDAVVLWTGMGLVAGAIFTVRYYYHLLPAELAMVLGGIVAIPAAYGLIRYLRVPKDGYTSEAGDAPHALESLPVEGLVVAETLQSVAQPLDQVKGFGGGMGGGAGASGSY